MKLHRHIPLGSDLISTLGNYDMKNLTAETAEPDPHCPDSR